MNNFLKKEPVKIILSFVFIFFTITPVFSIFLIPKQAQALDPISIPVQDVIVEVKSVKEEVWRTIVKEALMIAARRLINKITQSTIDWINSGYHGNPFFIENPGSFFKDIAKSEIRTYVDRYGYDKIKFPFGKNFALKTISSYQQQLDANMEYSLSQVIQDPALLDSYQNDFNVGGWNGFLINTQYPQNNYLGFNFKASDELARKLEGTVQTKTQEVQDTLQKSQGFLSPKLCMDKKPDGKPTGYNNGKNEFLQPRFDQAKWIAEHPLKNSCGVPLSGSDPDYNACVKSWNASFQKAKEEWTTTSGCKDLAVTTPGGVVGNQVKTALESKLHQAELASAMGNSVAAVFDALLNDLMKRAGSGLKGLFKRPAEDPGAKATLPNNWKDYNTDTPGSPSDTSGGKCIEAKGVSIYDEYVEAVDKANNVAYPNGLPSGTSPQSAQTAVCAAYKGRGSCSPGKQEDELIISGLPAPYVTLSIDFLAGNPFYLWASAVAACEVGVQEKDPNSPNSCIDPSKIGMCIKIPLEEKIISPYQCWAWCIEAGGERVSSMSASCTNTCYLGKPDTEKENMNRDACLERCTKGGGGQNACLMSCNSLYYNSPGGAPGDKPPKDE